MSLFELADEQRGYVTTKQANEVGITRHALAMMQRRGSIQRISHGLYRLRDYPVSPLDQYMEAVLWPIRERGVVSHESALALFRLSDVNPQKVHITLSPKFRVRREAPHYLSIHRADLKSTEKATLDGIPVTNVERSIRDASKDNLGPSLIRQAIDDAVREGHLNRGAAARLRSDLLGTGHSK